MAREKLENNVTSKTNRHTKEIVMAKRRKPILDSEEERDLDAECLVLEMAGQTWHIPFDTLQVIPRVGETIRLAGANAGKVAQVEYEFAPEAAPIELAREMPAAGSYARPVRIVVRLS
jgi:hypothetical protein